MVTQVNFQHIFDCRSKLFFKFIHILYEREKYAVFNFDYAKYPPISYSLTLNIPCLFIFSNHYAKFTLILVSFKTTHIFCLQTNISFHHLMTSTSKNHFNKAEFYFFQLLAYIKPSRDFFYTNQKYLKPQTLRSESFNVQNFNQHFLYNVNFFNIVCNDFFWNFEQKYLFPPFLLAPTNNNLPPDPYQSVYSTSTKSHNPSCVPHHLHTKSNFTCKTFIFS